MSKDRFGHGTEENISEKDFKQALKNEVMIMRMMKKDSKFKASHPDTTFKVNPKRENLKIITDFFMQNPKIAGNMVKSDEEFWNNMRMHLYPEHEKNRWGMSKKEWGDRNKGFFGKLFSKGEQ